MSVLTLIALSGPALSRAKTDTVKMYNGDRLTVEIKELSLGKLKVKTNDMGTIDIEWDKISAIHSDYHFQVTGSAGDVFIGTLEMADSTQMLRVTTLDSMAAIPQEVVVAIEPIARTFFSRVDGSLNVGYSYTKASAVAQATFSWSNIYRGERHVAEFDASSIITDQKNEETTTTRIDSDLSLSRLLGRKKWFGTASIGYQRNDELGLKNRFLATSGMGVNLIRTNHSLTRVSTSLAWNVEASTDSTGTVNSAELDIDMRYRLFNYDSPKTNVDLQLEVFPSLTEARRYRMEFDAIFSREAVKDLIVQFQYYTSTDNKSPATGGWKSDYGIVASVGWTY